MNLQEVIQNNQLLTTAIGLGGAGIVTFWIKDVPRKIYQYLKRELTTELIITSHNIIFHEVLSWIEKKYSNKNFRKLKLTNGQWGSQDKTTTSIGYGFHFIKYKNVPILIRLIKEQGNQSSYDKEELTIIKLGRSRKLFDQLIKEVKDCEKDMSKTEVYKMEDCWIHVKDQKKRSMDSIFIEKKKKNILIESLEKFIKDEEWYIKNGIPYQLGILLYGASGTGKTSLIRAIAGYLNYPIYYLSPQRLNRIELAMSTLPEKCVVVIEDIDTNYLTHSREKKNCLNDSNTDDGFMEKYVSVSLSEVLNSLDGMFSSHGRILLATTNHIEKLDSALIRAGRFDLKIEVGFVNHEILKNFVDNFFPNSKCLNEIEDIKIKPDVSVSTLQNMVLQNKTQKEIIEFVRQ